jgi:hypothetical protein
MGGLVEKMEISVVFYETETLVRTENLFEIENAENES